MPRQPASTSGLGALERSARRPETIFSTLFAAATGARTTSTTSGQFNKVGIVDLESFYPAKDRFALAMRLNNLLAAPGFSAWLEGDPLDVQSIHMLAVDKRHGTLSYSDGANLPVQGELAYMQHYRFIDPRVPVILQREVSLPRGRIRRLL